MAVVYYVTWMDPTTGFLKRREFDLNSDMERFYEDLKKRGIPAQYGHFER